jgi:hypothetical protein
MADHEGQTALVAFGDQILALGDGPGEGFLDKRVFAGLEAGQGEPVVGADGGGDDNGVELLGFQQLLEAGRSLDLRVEGLDVPEALFVAVTDELEPAIG